MTDNTDDFGLTSEFVKSCRLVSDGTWWVKGEIVECIDWYEGHGYGLFRGPHASLGESIECKPKGDIHMDEDTANLTEFDIYTPDGVLWRAAVEDDDE